MGGSDRRRPRVIAVDPVGAYVHAATDTGDRLRIPLLLRADGERLTVCADERVGAHPARSEPIALWDWLDRPALPVGTELWTVEEAVAAALATVCAQTGAGPETAAVLVVPATFGAVRRARVAAAAGERWILCDSGAAAVLGAQPVSGAGPVGPAGERVVVEDAGRDGVHALVVDDPWRCGADGRPAAPVAPPWTDPQVAAAVRVLRPAGGVADAPLWSARAEAPVTGRATARDLVLLGALRYAERFFRREGTGSPDPAS